MELSGTGEWESSSEISSHGNGFNYLIFSALALCTHLIAQPGGQKFTAIFSEWLLIHLHPVCIQLLIAFQSFSGLPDDGTWQQRQSLLVILHVNYVTLHFYYHLSTPTHVFHPSRPTLRINMLHPDAKSTISFNWNATTLQTQSLLSFG